jgi:cytochrome c peroxidase
MKHLLCILSFIALPAAAEPARDMLSRYAAEAGPGFSPSAERGRQFYHRNFGISRDMPACTSCHTEQPGGQGEHAITGKRIAPLAPAANPERFTRSDKTEKWFRRNCREVVGRECRAGEKADFLVYLLKEGSK